MKLLLKLKEVYHFEGGLETICLEGKCRQKIHHVCDAVAFNDTIDGVERLGIAVAYNDTCMLKNFCLL